MYTNLVYTCLLLGTQQSYAKHTVFIADISNKSLLKRLQACMLAIDYIVIATAVM